MLRHFFRVRAIFMFGRKIILYFFTIFIIKLEFLLSQSWAMALDHIMTCLCRAVIALGELRPCGDGAIKLRNDW